MSKLDKAFAQLVQIVGILLVLISLLYGLFLFAPQILHFLRAGSWEPQGFLTYAGQAFNWEWAQYPRDWLGVHALLNWFNAAFLVTTIGFVTGVALANFKAIEDEK